VRIDAARSAYDRGSPFFASRPEQLVRGIGQTIPLHHQLPNLRMQLLDIGSAPRVWRATAPLKGRRHVVQRYPFPCADLIGMNAVILAQFRQRHFFADRLKRNTRLEIELLSNLVFEDCWSCSDLVLVLCFNSVFERDACDDFGEVVKAA
jgi:hypothetical protein